VGPYPWAKRSRVTGPGLPPRADGGKGGGKGMALSKPRAALRRRATPFPLSAAKLPPLGPRRRRPTLRGGTLRKPGKPLGVFWVAPLCWGPLTGFPRWAVLQPPSCPRKLADPFGGGRRRGPSKVKRTVSRAVKRRAQM